VIRATFLHIRGVGPVTEAELWRRGVRDWADVDALSPDGGLPGALRERLKDELRGSETALAERSVE
jgi:hypothetical protein